MAELKDKIAVVTGGARGIGKAIAERFVQAGATVVIGDIRDELAAKTAAELGDYGEAIARHLDVRDWAGVEAFFSEAGRVDVSVNNAGVQEIAPSLEMSQEAWNEVLAVNLSGVFACAQAAGRSMAHHGGGSIINIASAAAALALPGRAPYCASKGAVVSLTKVLGSEWAPHGIRVNAIGPGWVKTDLVGEAIETGKLAEDDIRRRTPLDRLGTPDEIAELALFLASDRSSYFTGQTLYPDGGFTTFGGWR